MEAMQYYSQGGQAYSAAGAFGYTVTNVDKYRGAVFAPSNGNVYFIPFVANAIGVLDTSTNVFSAILGPYTGATDRYSAGVLSSDGSKIYMIPYDEAQIGVLDVNTHAVTKVSV